MINKIIRTILFIKLDWEWKYKFLFSMLGAVLLSLLVLYICYRIIKGKIQRCAASDSLFPEEFDFVRGSTLPESTEDCKDKHISRFKTAFILFFIVNAAACIVISSVYVFLPVYILYTLIATVIFSVIMFIVSVKICADIKKLNEDFNAWVQQVRMDYIHYTKTKEKEETDNKGSEIKRGKEMLKKQTKMELDSDSVSSVFYDGQKY